MGLRRRNKPMYVITIECTTEPDVLKRIAVLNAAMFRILQEATTKLVEVCGADYATGRLEFLVQAEQRVYPDPVPAEVTVRYEHATEQQRRLSAA